MAGTCHRSPHLAKKGFSLPLLMKSKQSACRLSESSHRPQQHSHKSCFPKQLSGKELRNYLTPSTGPRIVLCICLASTLPQHRVQGAETQVPAAVTLLSPRWTTLFFEIVLVGLAEVDIDVPHVALPTGQLSVSVLIMNVA